MKNCQVAFGKKHENFGSDFVFGKDARINIGDVVVSVQGVPAYAESHRANLAVNINSGEFIFIFATGLENQGG